MNRRTQDQSNASLQKRLAELEKRLDAAEEAQRDFAVRRFKSYVALLTQTGTSAPVATPLENTLGGNVVWTRTAAGRYVATLANAFPANKTAVLVTLDDNAAVNGAFGGGSRVTASTVEINTFSTADAATMDDYMAGATVEIRAYQ